ncbi:isopentenyl-diphosphate Delta-isomerase [Pedobacter sp. ASV28]|jgi:isopentenyl-diphosphate Delta-isomerase|uniref:isopentenyl-diphosphate Delta-isomerase n=1 Tax=Pedobacter sp. ASV28 TaxID=2795123 RepID=UPI0018ECCCDB|nr:isopentenyl-diphosphate Delta-isomerase [Pedobacter sp. ASV28]
MAEQVVLVDEKDRQIGLMDKMQAHVEARLHRAFSVFLFNDKNELLLQQRAQSKYHCGGLWTNTCCSHPRSEEKMKTAVDRRLLEEMGIICHTEKVYDFIYKAQLENGLYEHEFDHVFFGRFSEKPNPNPKEVVDWKYMEMRELKTDIDKYPEKYTPWFKLIFEEICNKDIANIIV